MPSRKRAGIKQPEADKFRPYEGIFTVKSRRMGRRSEKLPMQGTRILRNETYRQVRRRWAFCEAVHIYTREFTPVAAYLLTA